MVRLKPTGFPLTTEIPEQLSQVRSSVRESRLNGPLWDSEVRSDLRGGLPVKVETSDDDLVRE